MDDKILEEVSKVKKWEQRREEVVSNVVCMR